MIIRRYLLRIQGPEAVPAEEGSAEHWRRQDEVALEALPEILREAEENISDLLPESYWARFEEIGRAY